MLVTGALALPRRINCPHNKEHVTSAQQGQGGLAMLNSEPYFEEARFLISPTKAVCTKQDDTWL